MLSSLNAFGMVARDVTTFIGGARRKVDPRFRVRVCTTETHKISPHCIQFCVSPIFPYVHVSGMIVENILSVDGIISKRSTGRCTEVSLLLYMVLEGYSKVCFHVWITLLHMSST